MFLKFSVIGVLNKKGSFEITAHWSFNNMEPFPTANGALAWFIIHKAQGEGVVGTFAFKVKADQLGSDTLLDVVNKFVPEHFGLTSKELLKHFKDDFAVIYSNSPTKFTILESISNPAYKQLFGPNKLFSEADGAWEIEPGMHI